MPRIGKIYITTVFLRCTVDISYYVFQVIACVNNQEEMDLLQYRYPSICGHLLCTLGCRTTPCVQHGIFLFFCFCLFLVDKVVNLNTIKDVVDTCLQETGGLGANCILDTGGS